MECLVNPNAAGGDALRHWQRLGPLLRERFTGLPRARSWRALAICP